jgi:hypothetical protein
MRIHFKRAILCTATLSILLSGLFASPSIAERIGIPPTPPTSPPANTVTIPLSTFIYVNGTANFSNSPLNQQYFQGCFQDVYSTLGVSPKSSQPLGPARSSARSPIAPPFTLNDINNLSSLQIDLRHDYLLSRKGPVKVYLVAGADEDGARTLVGTIPSRLRENCTNTTFDLTAAIKEFAIPGVYQILFVSEDGIFGFSDVVVRVRKK